MRVLDTLAELRQLSGKRLTHGLSDAQLAPFADDSQLQAAAEQAIAQYQALKADFGHVFSMDEAEQIEHLQNDYVNFYAQDAVNPYVALAAKGPWIITAKGAVIHDNGGYGMLGFGHAPEKVLKAMAGDQVMANIMTASFSQKRLADALRQELGGERSCPYERFLCLNSGSEAVTVAARISDINAKLHTDPGGQHAGKPIRILGLKGAFHGRTDRPARFSDSTRKTYRNHLASFRDCDNLLTVEPNNVDALKEVFAEADQHGWFIESMFMEPVMGEGNPGQAISREFYETARQLTAEHGCLLLVDSIQAGLRAQGCLSICDYPGMQGIDAPDMETYSKALNAGQYPLSVLAMTERAANLYRKGVYGNTMTTNPRAMDTAVAVLEQVTPELRANIRDQGKKFLEKFEALKSDLGGLITKVQGTGLLFSVELDPSYKAYGAGSSEEYMRMQGVGVIHGGENSLRYTPHFSITDAEVDLIVEATRDALLNGPRQQQVA